jgi:EAL domain-containing protein (putative c-di-GMP-specific phosphodiesterase class I)
MTESIRIYHEHLPELSQKLAGDGSLALVLLDASLFGAIEEQYGTQAYKEVRRHLFHLVAAQSGKDFRREDILALDEPGGLRILLFLSRQRKEPSDMYENLEALRLRLVDTLLVKLSRTALPYLKNPPHIATGVSLAIHNPLLDSHRIIMRGIREALAYSQWRRQTEEMEVMHQLRIIILQEKLETVYQPIVGIQNREPLGFEALSRGGPGGFRSADSLFDAAIRHQLLIELDRVCRKRALIHANRLPAEAKIFINTLPATIRDPEFRGQYLVDLLGQAGLAPERIVIEITEKLVIANLSLFQEAMSYFTDLGTSLAVDDVGAGYSGLETIARLKPAYLKVDASLVRDVNSSPINREMLKAIVSLGNGIGAKVIAEGIQTYAELEALAAIGIKYGQGFYLGRPE